MKSITLILLIAISLASAEQIFADPPKPFWGGNPIYKVNVSFLNNDPVMRWNLSYYYNWNLKAERYEHQGPHADELCLAADPPFSKNDSCTAIFATDGWSYVVYPQYSWCCKCGNSFGAIRYDWLQTNSTFQGSEK